MICDSSVVRGNVRIASDTVVHPHVNISSTNTTPGALKRKSKRNGKDGSYIGDDIEGEELDQERVRNNSMLGTNIGHRNIIEEMVSIADSKIGALNIIEVGTHISGVSNSYASSYIVRLHWFISIDGFNAHNIFQSLIGDGNYIGPKVVLINCIIGDRCSISPMTRLEGVTIDDSMSVYPVRGRWQCRLLTAEDFAQLVSARVFVTTTHLKHLLVTLIVCYRLSGCNQRCVLYAATLRGFTSGAAA